MNWQESADGHKAVMILRRKFEFQNVFVVSDIDGSTVNLRGIIILGFRRPHLVFRFCCIRSQLKNSIVSVIKEL